MANILGAAIERVRQEEQIQALNADLEARVAARTTALATTVGDLEREVNERTRGEAVQRRYAGPSRADDACALAFRGASAPGY